LVKAALGAEHPLVASAESVLGRVADAQGRAEEAEAHQRSALALAEKIRGPDHLLVARYAVALGDALSNQSKHTDAADAYLRAQRIYEKAGNEAFAARTEARFAGEQLALGKRAEAKRTLEKVLAVQEAKDPAAVELAVTRFALARAVEPDD